MKRVAERVRRGGHSIPEIDIRRRYSRGVHNLFLVYRDLLDGWIAYDSSDENLSIIAIEEQKKLEIIDSHQFSKFKESGNVK
jgi:predicted ABC-type ATPase